MVDDGSVLLATLAQSAAAVVAIIGGFLVSRLVALSSEREGLRRQRAAAEAHLLSVAADYEAAHEYRLGNSIDKFEGWALDCLVDEDFDEAELFRNRVPRGSSEDEMRPGYEDVRARVEAARNEIKTRLTEGDDRGTDLGDLEERGLVVGRGDERVYDRVMYRLRSQLPKRSYGMLGSFDPLLIPPMSFDPGGTAARRLDESIRDEQNLLGRKVGLGQEVERLTGEIERIGRPVGVTPAIVILAFYSLLGIALPLVVMVLHLPTLKPWLEWSLLCALLLGLAAVLGYILWYSRSLSDRMKSIEG